jgi:hypothetical protein
MLRSEVSRDHTRPWLDSAPCPAGPFCCSVHVTGADRSLRVVPGVPRAEARASFRLTTPSPPC